MRILAIGLGGAGGKGLSVDVLVRAKGDADEARFADLESGIREAVEALWSDAS